MRRRGITLTNFKSFVKKNRGKLYIQTISDFDGMVDGVRPVEDTFTPAIEVDWAEVPRHTDVYRTTLGIRGVWLALQSRDYFNEYEDDQYTGYRVYNCCGSFIVAIKKEAN